jgi:hypothetical protein
VPDIVPVELTLPSGTWVTLYQRGWDDADDDSLAFLGGDDAVYAFPSAEALTSYVLSSDDHHLGASPLWPAVQRWSRGDFVPGPEDRYDLRTPNSRGQEMLAELLVYLRMEVPEGDWSQHPLAAALPQPPSYIPLLYIGADFRLPNGGLTLWEWAVSEVDARLGAPPSAEASALVLVVPIEEVASGVESLWLGLDDAGAHTLVVRDDEAGWQFLGEPGRVVTAGSAAGLLEFVSHGVDPALEVEPWSSLRGRDDIDVEPYEDNVIDLDELGRSIGPGLDRGGAGLLLDARPLMHELATWLGLDDVVRAFDEDQPLGRFFVRDLLDLAGGDVRGSSRLKDVDFEAVTASWQACVSELASRLHWVD